MSNTPRIPNAEITGFKGTLVKAMTRRMLGEVPEPLHVMWHNQPVLTSVYGLGRKAEKWDACDNSLKAFAHMAVASLVGCSFCLDLGYFMAHHDGLDEARASQVPRWRESDVFSPVERDVLEYAEAMSHTPPTVSDDLSARVLDQLGPAATVELTAWIGFANLVARSNAAMGIESQGFSAACALPLASPSVDVTPG